MTDRENPNTEVENVENKPSDSFEPESDGLESRPTHLQTEYEELEPTWKDRLAMVLAVFSIVMPIVLVFGLVMIIFMVLVIGK